LPPAGSSPWLRCPFCQSSILLHADWNPSNEARTESISRIGSGGYHPRNTLIPSDGRRRGSQCRGPTIGRVI
jgi:hypothetical protein